MGYLGEEIKKLGFGFMRLPMNGEEVDLEQTCKMVDKYMEKGFTYFDTAYVYMNGKSEEAVRDAVVKRYPRESFQLATKMPLHPIKEYADYQPIFDTSLERTQAGYFDFYLLHALNRESSKKAEETGGWEFVQEMKKKGLVKHAGFSFHDSADALDEILSRHPEAEFVQLQINYADWESESVQSRQCYEVARKYNVPVVVAINKFHTDSDAEIAYIKEFCEEMQVPVSLAEVFAEGGEGGMDLAEKVCAVIDEGKADFKPLYDEKLSIKEKLNTIAKEIYRADGVIFTAAAEKAIKEIESLGQDKLPVCVAKTQYSLSDDPTKLGKPENFVMTVREVKLSAGAGFIVCLTGDIMTMPGLPKVPAAYKIDVDADGKIDGLF